MSNFIIAVGHTASGNVGCGVINKLDESNCTREIGALVAEYLQQKGYGVNLLRIDRAIAITVKIVMKEQIKLMK